jgi:hypothetical protein
MFYPHFQPKGGEEARAGNKNKVVIQYHYLETTKESQILFMIL